MNRPLFAFSAYNPSYNREIITEAFISVPVKEPKNGNVNMHKVLALWDTGATNSVITPHVIAALGLEPSGVCKSQHAGGLSNVKTYYVDIALPNKIVIQGVNVTECAEQRGKFDIIIGMDIISLGDFSVTGAGARRMVSFCLPSAGIIDFVQLLKQTSENKG